jgi:prevent-host-death family protein
MGCFNVYNSHMRTISVSEAKNGLSALLREVRGGATIVITHRGAPVAHLSPPASVSGVSAKAIELAQRGRLVPAERAPTGDWARQHAPVEPVGGVSIVAALLAERGEGH